MKTRSSIDELRQLALVGSPIDSSLALSVLEDKNINTQELLGAASIPRKAYFGNRVQIHIINNLRNGYCPEDCSYCAQRRRGPDSSIFRYTDKSEEEVLAEAEQAWESGAYRYCLVSAGRGPKQKSLEYFARLIRKIKERYPLEICLSAGLLEKAEDVSILARAGLNRYNHNLNTSEEHYPQICSTHSYQDRIETLNLLQESGIALCSGVIAGMGESSHDLVSLAMELQKRDIASIPVNFFLPVPGHALRERGKEENRKPEKRKDTEETQIYKAPMTADDCLRILSMFRLTNPKAEIRMAAGRELYLKERQKEALSAANSLFVSGYLNVKGSSTAETLDLIEEAGYEIELRGRQTEDLEKLRNNEDRDEGLNKREALSIKGKKELRPFLSSKRVSLLFFFFLLSFSSFSSLWPQAQNQFLKPIFSSFESKIRHVKLDNGLRLILMRRGTAPVLSAYIKFRVGSYDESKESYGIAHMLEHMLFKGTRLVGTRDFGKEEKYIQLSVRFAQKLDHWRRQYLQLQKKAEASKSFQKDAQRAKEEVARYQRHLDILNQQSALYRIPEEDAYIYASQGARGYNAYTSSDLTNYQVNLPSNRIEVWARLEADRMQNAVLRNFYTEREVVREERRMRVDNSPRRSLWEKFRTRMYHSHPYGHPIIGPMESIKFLDYEQAMQFYKDYYTPANTVIALVGNFDLDYAEKIVRKYFGSIPPRKTKPPREALPPKPHSLDVEWEGGNSSLLYMAWFKPPMPDPKDFYLEILGSILAGSPETRLYRRLVSKEKLAVNVFAENGVIGNRATNLFLIGVEPTTQASLGRIREIVLEELKKIQTEGPTAKELALAVRKQRLQIINYLQDNARLADLLSYFEVITGDYRILFSYNALLDGIQAKDIQEAASRYIDPKYTMSARLIPKKN